MDIQKLNLNPIRAKGDIQTLVCVPNAQWIQTMPECATLEQRKAYWGPCKETGGSCLRNNKLPKGSQRSPFLGKVREGVVNCCKCLLVRSCFLRSGHGQVIRCCQYPSNTCYSLFWQEKARSPGTTVTLQGPILAERRQISAGGSLRAGSPDLAQLHEGARNPGPNWPSGSSGHPDAKGWSTDCVLHRGCCDWVTEVGTGKRFTATSGPGPGRGKPWRGLWSHVGHSPSLFHGTHSSILGFP